MKPALSVSFDAAKPTVTTDGFGHLPASQALRPNVCNSSCAMRIAAKAVLPPAAADWATALQWTSEKIKTGMLDEYPGHFYFASGWTSELG